MGCLPYTPWQGVNLQPRHVSWPVIEPATFWFAVWYPANKTTQARALLTLFFFKDFIYLFLEGGEGKEKERERSINVWLPLACPPLGTWPATQACTLTGNLTRDPLVHSPGLNPLSHTSQGLPYTLKNYWGIKRSIAYVDCIYQYLLHLKLKQRNNWSIY